VSGNSPIFSARSRLHENARLVFIYFLIGVAIMGRVFWHPKTWVLGGYGDTQQFMWYLGRFWYAILHGQNVFYSYQINAPVGQNLMWNTSILAESALFGWLTPVISASALYNELWLLNFVLSCLIGRVVLRELGAKVLPAKVGGLLSGIMPYESSQMLFHLHLWMTAPILGMVLILIKLYKNRESKTTQVTWRSGLLFGLLAAFEFYTSLETCATFAMFAVLFWLVASILKKGPIVIGNKMTLGVAVLVCGVLCLPGMYGLFLLPGRPHGNLLPPGEYVNDFFTFFVPTEVYQFHAAWMNQISATYSGNYWENDGYIGIPACILMFLGARKLRKNCLLTASFITFIVIAILSLGPSLHALGVVTPIWLPWSLLQSAPFFKDIIPSRFMLYGDIFMIIVIVLAWSKASDDGGTIAQLGVKLGAGAGTENATKKVGSRLTRRWVDLLLVCLTVLSWLPSIPYDSSHRAVGEDELLDHPGIVKQLTNQAVFVLTSDQSIFMQTMADSGYQIAMVNPYGYTSNGQERDSIRFAHTYFTAPAAEMHDLVQQIVHSGATRILYFPVGAEDEIPPVWYSNLNQQFGHPLFGADHVLIWNVNQIGSMY
jgi:hypothetical protein